MTPVKVYCRFRPNVSPNPISLEVSNDRSVTLTSPVSGGEGQPRTVNLEVDGVFSVNSSQDAIFKEIALPAADHVLSGQNSTVFCYGQTASGKTYTMFGTNRDNDGLVPRAVAYLISRTKQLSDCLIELAMLEIYLEICYDLLGNSSDDRDRGRARPALRLREQPGAGGVYVEGLSWRPLGDAGIAPWLEQLHAQRRVATTSMNPDSSRSHVLIMVRVTRTDEQGRVAITTLNFADLAGSEQVRKSNASGTTLDEAKKINRSLSSLSLCIKALVAKSDESADCERKIDSASSVHVPYRDSKLTFLLKSSLGGNSFTTVLITCSLVSSDWDETLASLRFAFDLRRVKNALRASIWQPVPRKAAPTSSSSLQRDVSKSAARLGAGLVTAHLESPRGSRLRAPSISIAGMLDSFLNDLCESDESEFTDCELVLLHDSDESCSVLRNSQVSPTAQISSCIAALSPTFICDSPPASELFATLSSGANKTDSLYDHREADISEPSIDKPSFVLNPSADLVISLPEFSLSKSERMADAQLLQVPDAFSAHTALSPAHLSAPASTPIRSFHAAFPFPVATFLASPNGQQPSSVDDLKSEDAAPSPLAPAWLTPVSMFQVSDVSPQYSSKHFVFPSLLNRLKLTSQSETSNLVSPLSPGRPSVTAPSFSQFVKSTTPPALPKRQARSQARIFRRTPLLFPSKFSTNSKKSSVDRAAVLTSSVSPSVSVKAPCSTLKHLARARRRPVRPPTRMGLVDENLETNASESLSPLTQSLQTRPWYQFWESASTPLETLATKCGTCILEGLVGKPQRLRGAWSLRWAALRDHGWLLLYRPLADGTLAIRKYLQLHASVSLLALPSLESHDTVISAPETPEDKAQSSKVSEVYRSAVRVVTAARYPFSVTWPTASASVALMSQSAFAPLVAASMVSSFPYTLVLTAPSARERAVWMNALRQACTSQMAQSENDRKL